MGYLISAHITLQKPDVDQLASLPDSIGYRVVHHRSAGVYLIDTYWAARPPGEPFQQTAPATDIPLELPSALGDLEDFYRFLYQQNLKHTFRKSDINFNLMLSQRLQMPVLSLVSDDDELDFACTSDQGSLLRLKCHSGDLLITYEAGQTHLQPLLPEFEEDDEFLSDLNQLRVVCPGATVAQRDVPWDAQLHAVATNEWLRFADTDRAIIGLGSFDPPEDEPDWEFLGQRPPG